MKGELLPRLMSSDCYGDYLRGIGRIPLLTPSEELHLGGLVQRWLSDPVAGSAEERRGRRAFVRMVTANLRLVVSLCKHQHDRISRLNMDPMDAVQAGNLGLMRAVERFLPERGYRFSTYGSWWIRQAVNRHLQESAGVIRMPPQMAGLARKVHALRSASPQPLSLETLGGILGESERRLETALLTYHQIQTCSLDQTIGLADGEVSLVHLIADQGEPGLEDDYGWFHQELNRLNSLEREVIRLRYVTDQSLTLAQTGVSLGLAKHKVQHLERRALRKLRQRLDPALAPQPK